MDKQKHILLVGATGRLGRMVLHHWDAAPRPLVKISQQHRDQDRRDGVFWPLQTSASDVLTTQPKIDAIVCLAGVTLDRGTDLSLNVSLAEAVLAAAHRAGIPRVLLASSSAVYGAGDGTPFAEDQPTKPVNDYGAAKVAMEDACGPWRDAGLEVCCLRIGNVAGADALLLNVARAQGSDPVFIDRFDDGRGPVRSYIGAGTLAEVLLGLALSDKPLPDAVNVATPQHVFMEDLARAADHPFTFRPAPDGAHQTITLDCRRIAALHPFGDGASDPREMVAQWKDTLQK